MPAAELFREALRAIRTHALRSFLTLLGIVIGVATLVGVISVIAGLNAFVREKLFGLAPDVVQVSKIGLVTHRREFFEALKRPDITWSDFERLRRLLRKAQQVGAAVTGAALVKSGDRRLANVRVSGTTASYADLMNVNVETGRFFLEDEERGELPLAVIGADVREALYPHLDPIGRTILLDGAPFRVIGLLAEQGRVLGQTRDNVVIVPLESYRRVFGRRDSLDILIQARGGVAGVEAAADEARALLRAIRHTDFRAPDPFGVVTAQGLQRLWEQITAAAFLLTVLIASVSLGIGGIVIMNIMLVAVTERTQEIGLRRALGARRRDVRRQFLLEAGLLSLAGGLAGVCLGGLIALAVGRLTPIPASLTPLIAASGLALSVGVGVAAGYWPAVHAANLLPVDALRAE